MKTKLLVSVLALLVLTVGPTQARESGPQDQTTRFAPAASTQPGTLTTNTVSWERASVGLPTTGDTLAIAFGDYDNDGDADLFVGTKGSGVQLWANDGKSNWTDKSSAALPTSGEWYGLAAADFNHDGLLDVVAAGARVGVRVYTQSRSGWTETVLNTSGTFYELAAGDMNNDGHPDLVAANHGASGTGIYIYWNNDPEGWIANPTGIDIPVTFWGVDVGDINNDGLLDIAAGQDLAAGGVYVWRQSAVASWPTADTGLPKSDMIWRDVAFGDFNNDGKLDLAATSEKGLRVWTGNGSGTWTAAAIGLPTSGDYAGLAVGDLDNDGKLDLAAVRLDNKGIEPWRNMGGSWQMFAQPDDAYAWWNLALADVDNDGLLDLGATSQSNIGVQVWVNSGATEPTGNWREIVSPTGTGSPDDLVGGDVNWDGNLDLVAAMGTDAGLRAWRGDGGNTWTDCSMNLPSTGTFNDLALRQLTGAAYPELIAGSDAGIKAYYNEGCYWNLFSSGLPTTGQYNTVAAGDIDHDGKTELVGAKFGGGLPMWRYDGGAWTPIYSPTLTSSYYDVALADLNNDGELDIAAANYFPDSLGVRVWLYNGPAAWTAQVVTSTGEYLTLAVGDLNNDGKLDIAAAKNGSSGEEGIWLWLGDGAGANWTPFPSPVTTGQYFDLDLADFNHDGFLDLLAGRDGYGVDVWAGNGAGGWTESSTNLPTSGAFFVSRFGHIDHDGFPDLLTTQYNGGIRLWTAAEATPPGVWSSFNPTTWISSTLTVTTTIQVQDSGSGLNVGSAQYAYSTDAGVSWSSWLSATLSGSNGVTTPQTLTAIVAFGQDSLATYRNRVRFRASDMVGNVGTSGDYQVYIDTTPPTNPTSLWGDPSTSTWFNDSTPLMSWSGAADASSGVLGYSYEWSTSSTTTPDASVDTFSTSAAPIIPGDGANWYFHVRARDAAGNWASGATHQGPYWLDTTPPINPTTLTSSPTAGVWTTDNTVYVAWSGGSDTGGSGLYGYSYEWSTSASTIPDFTVDTTGSNTTSFALPDGTSHYFHLRARDVAGNWSNGIAHYGPFWIDRTDPWSYVTSPSGEVGSTSFTVSWTGGDAGSGIDNYDVQHKDVTTGGSWTSWRSGVSYTSATFYATSGHKYQFRSRARDNVGNVEAWPGDYDVQVVVATEDFDVDHTGSMEVTQAVQDRNNSVILIQDKSTFVRFHVHSHTGSETFSARLSGWRGGTFLGNVLPSNAGGVATIGADPDRGQINQSFWFQLPSSWLHGTVQLIAEANYDHRLGESDYSDNYGNVTVSFQYSPPMNILLVDACYQSGGTTYHVRNQDRWALASYLRRMYPINQLNVWWGVFVPCYGSPPNSGTVNGDLMWNKIWAIISGEDFWMRYYGMVDDGYWRTTTSCWMRGAAYDIPALVASGPAGRADRCATWDPDGDSYADWYGAHELGHAYNRGHANFCDAAGGPAYPYPNGDISPSRDEDAANALYGFDVERHVVYPPSWKDTMTYCDNEWPSDFTYEGIHSRMVAEKPAMSRLQTERPNAGEYLAVFGAIITATDQVTLNTFYRVTNAWDLQARVPGEYSIRLLNGSGGTLADYAFTPRSAGVEPGPGGIAQAGTEPALISEFVLWVTDTARVSIYHGATELVSRLVSTHAPTVTVVSPNGGENLSGPTATLTWSASDVDGDSLTFTILYSVDGGAHWKMLGSNVSGTSLVISTSLLAGTTQGRFRVFASDGVNTASDDSNGNFGVPLKPPELHLIAPLGTSLYVFSQTVAFEAEAYDVEDGPLGDAAFTWTSSLSGTLGTGRNLALADLITGTHTITVTVTDSNGQQAQATTTVVVADQILTIYLPIILKNSG